MGIELPGLWGQVCALTQCQCALQRRTGTWRGQQVAQSIFPACWEAGAWECPEPVGTMLPSWHGVDRATVKLWYGRDFPLIIFSAEYLKLFLEDVYYILNTLVLFFRKMVSDYPSVTNGGFVHFLLEKRGEHRVGWHHQAHDSRSRLWRLLPSGTDVHFPSTLLEILCGWIKLACCMGHTRKSDDPCSVIPWPCTFYSIT